MQKSSSYKWVVLLVFIGVAALSQMLWLNFAVLNTILQERYGIDEFTSTLPVLVFPLIYVLLSVHAGGLIDRKGYRYTVTLGAIVMSVSAVVRIYDANFWVMLAGQTGIAIAQPYIINGISKLVADWFPGDEGAGATGLGTAGMFLGMALGVGVTIPLIDGFGFSGMLMLMAGLSVIFSLLFIFLAKEKNAATSVVSTGTLKDYALLLKNKNLLLINIISFIALGFFNGIFSFFEPILAEQGIASEDAGNIAGLLILGGIIGAAVIPLISDKIRKRKPVLIFCAAAAAALAYPVMTSDDITMAFILWGALGFFFLPGYAMLISSSEEEAGKSRAGAATGLLMLMGNLGGVIVITAMEMIKGDGSWLPTVYFCVGILAVAVLLACMMRETFGKTAQ